MSLLPNESSKKTQPLHLEWMKMYQLHFESRIILGVEGLKGECLR